MTISRRPVVHAVRKEGALFLRARRQLTVLLVAFVVILYVASAAAIYGWMDRLTMSEVDTVLEVTARPIIHRALLIAVEAGLSGTQMTGNPAQSQGLGSELVVVRSASGALLYQSLPGLAESFVKPPLQDVGDAFLQTVTVKQGRAHIRVLTQPVVFPALGGLFTVQVGLNIGREETELLHLRQVLLGVGALGALAALLIGFFASGKALQPIARSWQRQRQFVADASHELRTPLAVIQSNLDVVLSHTQGSILDNLEWLSNAKAEARRLTKLTDDLLTLAKTDSAQTQIRREAVSLATLIERVVEALEPLAQMKGLSLCVPQVSAPEADWMVQGDAERLYQLLIILVDNAIKYTEQGHIDLRLSRTRSSVRLDVADTGIGISKEDLVHVFDRFFRGDKARERAQGGTGLGLAIAQWIAQAHGGRIVAESTPQEGSVFSVTLPAAPMLSGAQATGSAK